MSFIDAGEPSEPPYDDLASKLERMSESACPKWPSIYRVPEHLRQLNANAYTPWHVSIGPYHHNDQKYRVIEEHKVAYMKDLVSRAKIAKKGKVLSYSQKWESYVQEVKEMEPNARKYYAETIELSEEEFAKMLLIDGCFIVEFLCRKIQKLSKVRDEPTRTPIQDNEPPSRHRNFIPMYHFIDGVYKKWEPENDFIFQSTRTSFEVRRDLTLLENQLPYFVLERLFHLTFRAYYLTCEYEPTFSEIVYCAMRTSIPNIAHILSKEEVISETPPQRQRNTVPQANEDIIPMPSEPTCLCTINGRAMHEFRVPNATRLGKAGIHFRKSESPLLEINFDPNKGVLEMPVLIMWHHTETFFRNVMAYELYNHSTDGHKRTVSDYMCFMDDLIDTEEDVKQLVRHGIIQNWLESDNAVADLFNSITKHILANYSSYSDTCKKLNTFCNNAIRKGIAALRQDYFNQPWAIVYFISGVILQTTAAIIQAAFSVKNGK
ncbi:hypothetical protein Cgig2_010651 [Carnegiea gigantea]|uniref:Uncharacterized protein n=1 Tax=Carnegiea gigantea TaxID=171969 RepID=A0A9Q1GS38_9CARY|nr:hypothetical protein Cgig2_010651 [Carnegiea gigantea]